jgi:hypothetical protein
VDRKKRLSAWRKELNQEEDDRRADGGWGRRRCACWHAADAARAQPDPADI